VVGSNIADESAYDFIIAHTTMQPSEKDNKLNGAGNDRRQNSKPGYGHGGP
jgi:hypothetical protein